MNIGTKYFRTFQMWKPEELQAFAFGKPAKNMDLPWELGMVFNSLNYGREVIDSVAAWNDNETEDPTGKIGVSFIDESRNHNYTFYLYPTLVEETDELHAMTIIAKSFPNPPTSRFRAFRAAYQGGAYLLTGFYMANGVPTEIPGIKPILKSSLKIKTAADLSSGELEYEHGIRFMGSDRG